MAEFYVPISNTFFADGIAKLLNQQNKLTMVHNTHTILASKTRYFVELVSSPAIKTEIVGCVGLLPEDNLLSRIKHVSINPIYRRFGIATKLINVAIQNSSTDYVFMTIREDNKPSLMLAKRLGFVFVQKNGHLISVARRRI